MRRSAFAIWIAASRLCSRLVSFQGEGWRGAATAAPRRHLFRSRFYCDVSVNVAIGWPSPTGPSAVTCTVPAVAGRVRTTAARPLEFVVTTREERDPASVVNSTLAPVTVPPDAPGTRVTDKFNVVPCVPACPSPVLVNEAAGLPTTIHPPSFCVTPALSVPGRT